MIFAKACLSRLERDFCSPICRLIDVGVATERITAAVGEDEARYWRDRMGKGRRLGERVGGFG